MTNETTTGKAPSHILKMVRDREGKTPIWTPIGAMWPNKDGKGFNIELEAMPLGGRIVARVLSDRNE